MRGPYRTPDGIQWVSPPFRMPTPYPAQAQAIPAHQCLLERARLKAEMSPDEVKIVELGRGTPAQICKLTQALIDVSGRPEGGGTWTPVAIRQLMFDCGIGVDCAGYSQQAYLSMRHQTRAQAGFDSIANENLSKLGQQGFTRVPRVDLVRAGDIVVLNPPRGDTIGHRCIVYENRLATQDDLKALAQRGPEARALSTTPPVYVMQVDSSWGCGGNAMHGGVQRWTLFYSSRADQWALYAPPPEDHPERSPTFMLTQGPYGHPLEGFYRGPPAPGERP